MLCDVDDREAPFEGCVCRSCYRAREGLLDPEFLRLINGDLTKIRCSAGILQHATTVYLLGRMTLAEMNVSIIKALVQQNDELWDRAMAVLNASPIPGRIL